MSSFGRYSPQAQLAQMGVDRGQWDEDLSDDERDDGLQMPSTIDAIIDQRKKYPKKKANTGVYEGNQPGADKGGQKTWAGSDDLHPGAFDQYQRGTPSPIHNLTTNNAHYVGDCLETVVLKF